MMTRPDWVNFFSPLFKNTMPGREEKKNAQVKMPRKKSSNRSPKQRKPTKRSSKKFSKRRSRTSFRGSQRRGNLLVKSPQTRDKYRSTFQTRTSHEGLYRGLINTSNFQEFFRKVSHSAKSSFFPIGRELDASEIEEARQLLKTTHDHLYSKHIGIVSFLFNNREESFITLIFLLIVKGVITSQNVSEFFKPGFEPEEFYYQSHKDEREKNPSDPISRFMRLGVNLPIQEICDKRKASLNRTTIPDSIRLQIPRLHEEKIERLDEKLIREIDDVHEFFIAKDPVGRPGGIYRSNKNAAYTFRLKTGLNEDTKRRILENKTIALVPDWSNGPLIDELFTVKYKNCPAASLFVPGKYQTQGKNALLFSSEKVENDNVQTNDCPYQILWPCHISFDPFQPRLAISTLEKSQGVTKDDLYNYLKDFRGAEFAEKFNTAFSDPGPDDSNLLQVCKECFPKYSDMKHFAENVRRSYFDENGISEHNQEQMIRNNRATTLLPRDARLIGVYISEDDSATMVSAINYAGNHGVPEVRYEGGHII